MAVQKGRLIYLEVDLADVGDGVGTPNWVKVAQQRESELSRGTETADGTHKDDDGWARAVGTRRNWGMSGSGCLHPTDPAYIYLQNKWAAEATVWVRRNASLVGGAVHFGQAWITDFPETAPEGDVAGYSIEFQGDGPLKPTTI